MVLWARLAEREPAGVDLRCVDDNSAFGGITAFSTHSAPWLQQVECAVRPPGTQGIAFVTFKSVR